MERKKIYLIPGLMCDNKLWSKLYKFFDDSYELVPINIPLEKDFDKLLDSLAFKENEDLNIVGFSLGGYIASAYALKHEKKVKNLLVISASLTSLLEDEIEKRKKALKTIDMYGFKGLSKIKVKSLLDEKNLDNEELIKLIQKMYLNLGQIAFEKQTKSALYRKDLKYDVLKSNLKFNFLYSKKDRMLDHSWFNDFSKISKNSTFFEVDSYSHMLPLEKPEFVASSIKKVF